jgi:hypothetical protein
MMSKKYNTVEALKLMNKGKVMAREGHVHPTGYYYTMDCCRLIEHNGDGSVYNNSASLVREIVENKKNQRYWVIIKLDDKGAIICK